MPQVMACREWVSRVMDAPNLWVLEVMDALGHPRVWVAQGRGAPGNGYPQGQVPRAWVFWLKDVPSDGYPRDSVPPVPVCWVSHV